MWQLHAMLRAAAAATHLTIQHHYINAARRPTPLFLPPRHAGSRLYVARGKPEEVLPALWKRWDVKKQVDPLYNQPVHAYAASQQHSSTAAQQHSSRVHQVCNATTREARLLSRAGCVVRVLSPFIQLVLLTRTTLHRRHPRSNTTTASLYSAKQCGWWWYRLTYEVDTEPYAVSRDASISTLAADVGVAVESHTSHTLWDVDRYVHTRVCHAASDS